MDIQLTKLSERLIAMFSWINSSSSNRIASTTRCTACIIIRYRSQLRVRRHREKCHNVAHDSHTTYVCSHAERGTNGEVEELSKSKKITQVKIWLPGCTNQETNQEARSEDDWQRQWRHAQIDEPTELTPHVENEFNKDSPQYMLWKEQVKYNSLPRNKWAGTLWLFALLLVSNTLPEQLTTW